MADTSHSFLLHTHLNRYFLHILNVFREAEISEEALLAMAEETIKKVCWSVSLPNIPQLVGNNERSIEDMSLDELDELEDEESEKLAQQYRYDCTASPGCVLRLH